MPSLRERIEAMSAAELREEIYNAYRTHGYVQAMLYKDIRILQERIHQQRLKINELSVPAVEEQQPVNGPTE